MWKDSEGNPVVFSYCRAREVSLILVSFTLLLSTIFMVSAGFELGSSVAGLKCKFVVSLGFVLVSDGLSPHEIITILTAAMRTNFFMISIFRISV